MFIIVNELYIKNKKFFGGERGSNFKQ